MLKYAGTSGLSPVDVRAVDKHTSPAAGMVDELVGLEEVAANIICLSVLCRDLLIAYDPMLWFIASLTLVADDGYAWQVDMSCIKL